MSNQSRNTKKEIAKEKEKLEILEELELLESEFRIIKKEYLMRVEYYQNKLKKI